MLTKNECVEIQIIDLGDNGEGIGKVDNFTVFVHGGIPGDLVNAKIIKVKKQYAIGIVDSINESSSDIKRASLKSLFKMPIKL